MYIFVVVGIVVGADVVVVVFLYVLEMEIEK